MDPFIDDQPMPARPTIQETRRQPTQRTQREYAAAPSTSSKVASTRAATKSVLTRAPQMEDEEVSQAKLTVTAMKKPASSVKRTSATSPISESNSSQSSRRSATAIPHNPLR